MLIRVQGLDARPVCLILLGHLAKIKCSICSYQFNIWYVDHWSTDIKSMFLRDCDLPACWRPVLLDTALQAAVIENPQSSPQSLQLQHENSYVTTYMNFTFSARHLTRLHNGQSVTQHAAPQHPGCLRCGVSVWRV